MMNPFPGINSEEGEVIEKDQVSKHIEPTKRYRNMKDFVTKMHNLGFGFNKYKLYCLCNIFGRFSK